MQNLRNPTVLYTTNGDAILFAVDGPVYSETRTRKTQARRTRTTAFNTKMLVTVFSEIRLNMHLKIKYIQYRSLIVFILYFYYIKSINVYLYLPNCKWPNNINIHIHKHKNENL